MISSSWFNNYCSENNLKLVNGQSLEELRRKYCHENVKKKFYSFLQETIHQNPFLLYDMDETSCSVDEKGKLVVPVDGSPISSSEQKLGHITCLCTCNAAGESLDHFLILPRLMNLPEELYELQTQYTLVSSPSGWVISKLFFIWSMFFVAHLNQKRKELARLYGQEMLTTPCFLFLDGHKSRLNSMAFTL